MPARALVLGGGGPVGIAWESGIAAGLERAGVRLADADHIVGTSAGSVVGAQLALGRTEPLLAAQLAPPEPAQGAGAGSGGAGGAPDLGALLEMMTKRPAGEIPQDLRVQIGAFALGATTGDEESFIAGFGRAIGAAGVDGFPDRFACTAVDTADGAFRTWDRSAGVELGRAVASSCAVPGVYPPITIGGRRYMDGGVRSSTNADLASGFDRVVIVAVISGVMGEVARASVEAEAAALRAGGAEVRIIAPDAAAQDAFGNNVMDASRRVPVAESGLRQGAAEAEALREFWG